MRVMITGGTGFIGSRLALKCLDLGYSVKILGQENTGAEGQNKRLVEEKGAQVILGSVTERDLLFKALEGVDTVFHLAAAQHEMNIPDQKFWEVNVEGTRNMLDASVHASVHAGVKRFVHGSTIGVYGSLEGEIDEDSPCNPDNIYGITKLEGEKLVLSYQNTLPVVVVRISETYGPGDRRLLKLYQAINKNVFLMIGNGRNLHHLVYIDDLVDGFLLAAANENALGDVFVLSGKEPLTTNEMVATIATHLGKNLPKLRIPLPLMYGIAAIMEKGLRPVGIQPPLHRRRMDFFRKTFVFSQDKASRLLGFKPNVPFSLGSQETAKWYRDMGYLS